MNYFNLKHPDQSVSFSEAVLQGLGRDRGLFFPDQIPLLANISDLLKLDFVDRSVEILGHFVGGDIDRPELASIVRRAFNFPVVTRKIGPATHVMELFHGPSLAFKDFGARFLAECLNHFSSGPTTILTATSGDTGAAVAQAFYGQPGIRVVILYPKGRVTPLQEKLFCTLGQNITTLAVRSDFDSCQRMVKQAFEDQEIRNSIRLNSANSINIGRLLAQVCYYFEAVARMPDEKELVISIPSGNFGNLTAGLIARTLGLPVKRLIAATNANDTVPRFLESGIWSPLPTRATLTNAMDISEPNNFPRVQRLADHHGQTLGRIVESFSLSDAQTRQWVRKLFEDGYTAEPHTALACAALRQSLQPGEQGLFLATAHPAKFREIIEETTNSKIPLPDELRQVAEATVLSQSIDPDFQQLKQLLTRTSD